MKGRQRFSCSNCGVVLAALPSQSGLIKRCPNCKRTTWVIARPPRFSPSFKSQLELLVQLEALANEAVSIHKEVFRYRPETILAVTAILSLPKDAEPHEILEFCETNLLTFSERWIIESANSVASRAIAIMDHLDLRNEWRRYFESIPAVSGNWLIPESTERVRRRWSIQERREVWLSNDRKCFYCGELIPSWRGEHMHLDHLHPLADGGADDIGNLVPSHPVCNLQKGKSVFPELFE